jgi:oligoribonuclease NrnB/cAMP/cGMP phosphodiesterase (DHH superfamily)
MASRPLRKSLAAATIAIEPKTSGWPRAVYDSAIHPAASPNLGALVTAATSAPARDSTRFYKTPGFLYNRLLMAPQKTSTVLVVSHGPSCLDGVVAAAVVARFHEGHRVFTTLASNSDSDHAIQSLKAGADELWITDLSWLQPSTAEHLRELASSGTRIYWIDHHRTAVSRADAPEFRVPFAGKVLSERYSAARLAFDYLKRREDELASEEKRRAFEAFGAFAEIADDHDRWVHRIPESSDWALAVQTLGGMASYREILKLKEPRMSRRLREALQAGREGLRRSIELADATRVDRRLANGVTVRSACCFGYSSEVAAHLYNGASRTVVALFDLRSQGVSLRRSPDCAVDLAKLAEAFGGGGHEAAAGFSLPDLRRVPAERLSAVLAERLETPKPEPL